MEGIHGLEVAAAVGHLVVALLFQVAPPACSQDVLAAGNCLAVGMLLPERGNRLDTQAEDTQDRMDNHAAAAANRGSCPEAARQGGSCPEAGSCPAAALLESLAGSCPEAGSLLAVDTLELLQVGRQR